MGLQISRPEWPAEAYIQVKNVPFTQKYELNPFSQHKKSHFCAEKSIKDHFQHKNWHFCAETIENH